MLKRLRSWGMSKRAFFFLMPPSRRGEKERGGVLGLMRLGPGRASISCWLKAIQSEWVCGDMGCSGAEGKTALGRTFWCTGSPKGICCWSTNEAAPKSPGPKGLSGLGAVGVLDPELSVTGHDCWPYV